MTRVSNGFLLSLLLGGFITSFPAIAFADVVLEPNTITGQVRFSNTDPTVVALLQQLGMKAAYVVANSTTPAGYGSTTTTWVGDALARDFELSAESAAGGLGGVHFNVAGNGSLYLATPGGYAAYGDYWFSTANDIVLLPVADQPSGASVTLEDCVGIVHVRWGTDASCDAPFVVQSGSIGTSRGGSAFWNTAEHWFLKQGDTDELRYISMTTGTDPGSNTFTFAMPLLLTATCDKIQEICIDMSPYKDGSADLGSMTGPFDVLGETEKAQAYVQAWNGPSGNYRQRYFSPPEMPELSPATWWTLPNMVAGDYDVFGQALFRTGRASTIVNTARMGVGTPLGQMTVAAGASADLRRNVGGQLRYPFVMTPAQFRGKVVLADPYVIANPGAGSPLSSLIFGTDPPWSSSYPWATSVRAFDADTGSGLSYTSFDGTFDEATGALSSTYEELVVNPYDIPAHWRQQGLSLNFDEPGAEREGVLGLSRDPTIYLLAGGDSVTIDHEYCFNEVVLPYSITNGALFDPNASVTGNFSGTDWQGNTTQYSVSGSFYGWPKTAANAAPGGSVRLALPQGTYEIQPGASVLSGSGATSSATFAKTLVAVECGQRVTVTPGLAISASLPLCAESASPSVTGAVASSGDAVDRIWYRLNGGPEIDICASNCGADPSFAAAPSLVACGNTIEIFASSGGQTTSVTSQTTWEDPSDGVDCNGECAPTPAPACAVVSAQPLACIGGDEGYQLTFEITNNTEQSIAHLMLSDPHVSPHTVTLPAPLAPGESTSVTVTVTDVNPGASLCLDVGMTDAAHDACCSQNVCFDIPACCFTVEKESAACKPGAAPGEFTYSFAFQNDTLESIEHVFLFPPPGITISTDYVDVPTTPPGGIASVGPISFSGATPGEQVCVTVSIHDEAKNECCADDICFLAPEPCEKPSAQAAREDAAACAVGRSGGSSSAGLLLALLALLGLARGKRQGAFQRSA